MRLNLRDSPDEELGAVFLWVLGMMVGGVSAILLFGSPWALPFFVGVSFTLLGIRNITR